MAIAAPPQTRTHEEVAGPRAQTNAGPCRFLLARPTAQDLDRLAAGGEVVRIKRGTHVFSEGDVIDSAWVIRRGRVALGRVVHGRTVTLLLLREGDILGDVPMLIQAPGSFDAVATADTELVRIPAARLVATLDRSPEFARRWVLWLSGRLSSAHTRLLSLLAGDIRSQVAAVLVQEACRGDAIRLTHHDIAAMVGAQRSSVTRALAELAAAGAIATGYGQVTIRDYDALVAVARTTTPDTTTAPS